MIWIYSGICLIVIFSVMLLVTVRRKNLFGYAHHGFHMIRMVQKDILETMEDGFLVFDTDEKVLYYNAAAKRFFPELEKGHCLAALGKIAEKEHIIYRRKNSVFRFRISPIYIRNVFKGYKAWVFDYTLEELQKKRLMDLKEQAEQANLAKTRFLASMSHEIRTPMNAILGMAQLMSQETELPEKLRESIDEIHYAGTSLLSMINDVLDFANIDSGNMEIVLSEYRIDELLHEIDRQMMRKLEEKDVTFEMEVSGELPSGLIGDELRLRQVLSVLLDNAIKYTDFGKIMLRAGIDGQNQEASGIPEKEKTILLSIQISDTGIGILEDSLPDIFQPFQQASRHGDHFQEGKGLGLSLAKRLSELMGGEILVKSVYGCGSTFQVLLPQKVADSTKIGVFVQGENISRTEEKIFQPAFSAPEAKVLAVDDNVVNLKVLKGLLGIYGIQAETALSGLECLEILKAETYDLILMDYMMPGMDGIETLHLIRNLENESAKTVPVVAVTADAVKGAREMFLAEGFQEYIAKPINRKHIESVLLKNLSQNLIQKEQKKVGEQDAAAFPEGQKQAAVFKIQVEGIDYERGLSLFAGDKEQYLVIMESIAEEGRSLCLQMSEELAAGDIRNYTIHAHTLKGITAGIGAEGFSEQARALEASGKEGKEDYIYQHHEEVMDAFEILAEGMDRLLGEERERQERESSIEISEEALLEKLQDIKENLEEYYQNKALKLVEECLSYRLEVPVREKLNDIGELIRMFRYEEPKKKTEELIAEIQKQG